MTTRRNEIISDAAVYSILSIVTQLLTLVTGVLTRKFLGPVQMGLWSLLQIILVYSAYSTLGVTEAISREIPFHRAKGETVRADFLKDVIVSFSLLTSGLISVGLIFWVWFFHSSLGPDLVIGLLIMAAMVILQRVSNNHIAFLRAYKHFEFAGKQMVVSSIFNAVIVIVLTRAFTIHGFMWAMCFSFVFNIIWVRNWHPFPFNWKLDWKAVWKMMQYGFPLMIVGLLSSLFLTINKIMIARSLGLHDLGIYSLAIMASLYINSIPNSIGIVLIPNFHEKFSEGEKPVVLRGYLLKSLQGFSDLMPFLILGVWCFGSYLAHHALPEFHESIPPMKALILAAFFWGLMHPCQYFIAVIRKQKLMIPITVFACILAIIANEIALRNGWGLIGVSIATVVVCWFQYTWLYFVSAPHVLNRRECLGYYVLFIAKFLYLVGAAYFMERVFPNPEASFGKASIQFGVFMILFFPFLIKLNRDLQLISVLKSKVPFFKPKVKKKEVDG